MLGVEENIQVTGSNEEEEEEETKETKERNSQEKEEITHHKLGKSCISKEQSPNVVRSKSRMASTSKSNVEVGRGLDGGGGGVGNSKSIDDEPGI